MVWLGQAEAADRLTARQTRQVFLLGRFVAEFINRHHHQRGLHTHHRTIAGVDALDFTRHQTVGDIAQARAAVLFRNGHAEQTQGAHFAEDFHVGTLVAERFQHARRQFFLAIATRRVTHHALFFRQLLVDQQWVVPVKRRRFMLGAHSVPRNWFMMAANVQWLTQYHKRFLCTNMCVKRTCNAFFDRKCHHAQKIPQYRRPDRV